MDFHSILKKLTQLEGSASSRKELNEGVEIHADGAEAMALLGHADAAVSQDSDVGMDMPHDDMGIGGSDFGGTDLANGPVSQEPSLGDIKSLAGLPHDDTAPEAPHEEEVGEDVDNRPYTNSPEELVKSFDSAVPSGNDLHKQKGAWPKANDGDNPRAMVRTLEAKLTKSFRDYLKESEEVKEDNRSFSSFDAGKQAAADPRKTEKDAEYWSTRPEAQNLWKKGFAAGRAEKIKEGKDLGKPGKHFKEIEKKASKEYGSKEAGERVAGAVLSKLRKKHPAEYSESKKKISEGAELVDKPWDTAVDAVAAKYNGKLKKMPKDEFEKKFSEAKSKKEFVSNDDYGITVGILPDNSKVIICKAKDGSDPEYFSVVGK